MSTSVNEPWRRPWLIAICVATSVMAALYVAFMPELLDLDEASYYATVRWYATHHSMPVLGDPGVSYEAQMGPGYFIPAALVDRIFSPLGLEGQFHAVRALGVGLLVALVLLTYLLAGRLCPASRAVPLLAAAIVGLNPHLLGLSGSVSNDLLSMVLGAGAVYLFVARLQENRLTARAGLAVGLLVALAVITKPSALALTVALPLALLVVRGRAALPPIGALIAGVAIGSGWWFARNVVLYGELGTVEGLRRWGFPLNRGSLDTPAEITSRVRGFATSYWAPSETFGDAFQLPTAVTLVAVAITVAAAAGWIRWTRQRRSPDLRVCGTVAITFALVWAVSIALHLYTHVRIISVAPRTTFVSYFVVASALALGLASWKLSGRGAIVATALLVTGLLAADLATLRGAHQVRTSPLPAGLREVTPQTGRHDSFQGPGAAATATEDRWPPAPRGRPAPSMLPVSRPPSGSRSVHGSARPEPSFRRP